MLLLLLFFFCFCFFIFYFIIIIIIIIAAAAAAAAANERPNYCAVAHLSHLLISVSFKIDDATLEPCLYEPYSIGGKKFRYS